MKISVMRSIRTLAFLTTALAVPILTISTASFAGIGISVTIAPPELPVYEQPVCPGDGYIWTPGYWAWDGDDYYWVPGTWVLAPEPGLLWTPAYWGWSGGAYVFYPGYWGPEVGFYGGIDYGFGYSGRGYEGGRWDNGHFFYNRSVNNVNVTVVHNVYNTTVVNENRTVSRVSFNGGNGGTNVRPTSQEEAVARGRHVAPVAAQNQQMEAARSNTQLRASENHGSPPIAATSKPGAFGERDVVAAKSGPSNAPTRPENAPARPGNAPTRPENAPRSPAVHPNDLPAAERPAAPNTGNAKLDQKYQQQQQKLNTQQDQARQKLQQQQDRDHQRMTQQKANDARTQQVEQQHQQQTQQMVQRQAQQQQHLQQRQQPAHQSQPQGGQPKAPEQNRGSNERH